MNLTVLGLCLWKTWFLWIICLVSTYLCSYVVDDSAGTGRTFGGIGAISGGGVSFIFVTSLGNKLRAFQSAACQCTVGEGVRYTTPRTPTPPQPGIHLPHPKKLSLRGLTTNLRVTTEKAIIQGQIQKSGFWWWVGNRTQKQSTLFCGGEVHSLLTL